MGNDVYTGPAFKSDSALITQDEVDSGEVKAPPGTETYTVKPGDTLYNIARANGYGDPPDMVAFYQDNPQYSERNPDLIYPGEIVFVRGEKHGPGGKDGPGEKDDPRGKDSPGGKDGPGEKPTPEAAAKETDAAAKELEQAESAQDEYMQGPGPKGHRQDYQDAVDTARQKLFDAIQNEIEAGLGEYVAKNPDATPKQIQDEANRLRHEIQGRSATTAGLDDSSMEFRTQQAINNVSAQQRGIDLGNVAPGTKINDGPYTETQGPFAPNSSVELKDGTFIKTDEHGYPDKDVNNDGVTDPTTPKAASNATDEAAKDLQGARDMKVPGGLQHEKEEAISLATNKVGDAVQQEIEVGLRAYIAANPDASKADIQQEAERLGHAILGRPGNSGVISESQVQFRTEQAIASVTQGK